MWFPSFCRSSSFWSASGGSSDNTRTIAYSTFTVSAAQISTSTFPVSVAFPVSQLSKPDYFRLFISPITISPPRKNWTTNWHDLPNCYCSVCSGFSSGRRFLRFPDDHTQPNAYTSAPTSWTKSKWNPLLKTATTRCSCCRTTISLSLSLSCVLFPLSASLLLHCFDTLPICYWIPINILLFTNFFPCFLFTFHFCGFFVCSRFLYNFISFISICLKLKTLLLFLITILLCFLLFHIRFFSPVPEIY